jgi:diguanylate cyclase (GGDEF)-like protein
LYEFAAAVGYDLEGLREVTWQIGDKGFVHSENPVLLRGSEVKLLNASLEDPKYQALVTAGSIEQIKSIAIVPIVVAGASRGYLYLDNLEDTDAFSNESLRLAQAFTGQLSLLLQRLQLETQVQFLAYHDPLTQLPNRRLFSERIQQAIAFTSRSPYAMAVLYIDLDNFKFVNDSKGHGVGDALLEAVAKQLKGCVRRSDTVARQGGDEFLVLLTNLQQPTDAAKIAEKILASLSEPLEAAGYELQIAASIGITVHQGGDDISPTELVQQADTALYQAKSEGKTTYRFFQPEMNSRVIERVSIETGLRKGLERNEFFLEYQPRIDLKTNQVVGAEALLRWQSAELGLVSPKRFIPIAEETGIILKLGEEVLRMACLEAARWQSIGLDLPISVNLSAHQLYRYDLISLVDQTLAQTGLNPANLCLELTESTLMEDVDQSIAVLKKLQTRGISVEVDDFGTGYSSLSYLHSLPISGLKIDRSFVAGISEDPGTSHDSIAITRTIIGLAKNLGLSVVAEGVENTAQANFLKAEGCNQVQGFLFARPMGAANLYGWCRGWDSNPHDL